MGWLSEPKATPNLTPKENKYSIEKVEALLTQFGPLRLRVADPRMKLLITQITWSVLPYLRALNSGSPRSADLADVMSTLDMLIQTVEGYIRIQNNQASGQNQTALLANGRKALEVNLQKFSAGNGTQASGLSDYAALTDFLTSG